MGILTNFLISDSGDRSNGDIIPMEGKQEEETDHEVY